MNGHSPNAWEGSRVMIIGSMGFIGGFIAEASLECGHPTYLLIRPELASLSKASTIKSLQHRGATTIYGSIKDQDLMEKVIREHKIEIVISAVGGASIADQVKLVNAIKAAGTVKNGGEAQPLNGYKRTKDRHALLMRKYNVCAQRFLPSEFGHDIDRADPVEPGLTMYKEKRQVRRYIEEAGIPYTYICCNSIAAWPYHDNTHPADVPPPLDRLQIYGDGTVKGSDIGKFTIKSIDDNRTLNKTVHFRPPSNLLSTNELATLWEEKLGYKLPRVTITEDDLLAAAREMRIPQSIVAAITHDIFINSCQINYSMDQPNDVDVCSLYPELPFRTVDECFNDFAVKMISNPKLVNKPANKNGTMMPNPKPEALFITA